MGGHPRQAPARRELTRDLRNERDCVINHFAHQQKPVNHTRIPGNLNRYTGVLQSVSVGFAFVPQRIVFGRNYKGRR